MAIPVNTLMEESKCYLCLGISQAEALELALLNRIAEGASSSPLEYTAVLSQSGAGNPVATVIKNTLGEVTFVRDDIGTYLVNSAGLFTPNKTVAFVTASVTGLFITMFPVSTQFIFQLDSDDWTGVIQILVYP